MKKKKLSGFRHKVVVSLLITLVLLVSTTISSGIHVLNGGGHPIDISVSLESGEVFAGEELIITTKILFSETTELRDVLVMYTLWDKDNKISEYSESIAVHTSTSIVKQIYIPLETPGGVYIIEAKVKNGSINSIASSSFIVKDDPSKPVDNYKLIFVGVATLFFVFFWVIFFQLVQIKNKLKISSSILAKERLINQKIQKK